jgi:uncharacterized membrane protein
VLNFLGDAMDHPSRSPFPRWPSFAVLLLAAAALTQRWEEIPPRWIVHWGPRGEPNGWATKDFWGVYGILMFAALILVISEATSLVRTASTTGPAADAVREATIDFVRLTMLGVSLMVAFLAVNLPLGPRLPLGTMLAVSLSPLIALMGVGAVRLTRGLREIRARGHGANVEGYHALYYANANDSRLWVPKLVGIGWTINFAHPMGWPVFFLILAVPIGVVVLVTMAR